jgi:BolA protein
LTTRFFVSQRKELLMGAVADSMRAKLVAAFSPESLEIIDDSDKHAGHSGAREGGESHFTIKIVASAFAKTSLVASHRMIMTVLKEELAHPDHALSIRASGPTGP